MAEVKMKAECRGCHAPVYFIPTKTGGRAIVDRKKVKVWISDGDLWYVRAGYQDHHATCPNADEFRKKK